MDLTSLLLKNRSYRGYSHEKTPSREELLGLIELTRLCASSGNVQPLKYLPVNRPESCAGILSLTRWAGRMKEPKLPHEHMEPTAYIIILHDTSVASNETPFCKDVGIVAQSMLLRAVEMGYGGCMLGGFSQDKISDYLDLPDNLKPVLIVALGVPGETVVLEDAPMGFVDRDHSYYRDENDVHHVWKRQLDELLAEDKYCE